jgi:hypothetical protein
MIGAAQTLDQDEAGRPAPLDVFVARCEAKALLAAHAQIDFVDAVDELQFAAVRAGLVDELGQDAVQRILAEAFAMRQR